jgi:hypothetical protein
MRAGARGEALASSGEHLWGGVQAEHLGTAFD